MKNNRTTLIALVTSLILPIVCESSLAECINPNYQPYKEGASLLCPIKWRRMTKSEAALFTPIDDKTWIGWLWSSAYFMEPVRLNVEKNDCDGIRFTGKYGDFDFRVFIDADSQIVSAVLADDSAGEPDHGTGYCRMLDEDDYALEVRTVNLK